MNKTKLFLSSILLTTTLALGFNNTAYGMPNSKSYSYVDKHSVEKSTDDKYKIDYTINRKKIADQMEDNSVLILFAGVSPYKSGDDYYQYTPERYFYYSTGIDEMRFKLCIAKRNNQVTETLFIDRPSPMAEKWFGKQITVEECTNISGIKNIKYLDEFGVFKNELFSDQNLKYLYLNNPSWAKYFNNLFTTEKACAKNILSNHTNIEMKQVSDIIDDLRCIKSKAEIENLKNAINLTGKGILNTMKNAKPGMMEYELEAYFNFPLTYAGVRDTGFASIIASGINATSMHYDKNNCKTGPHDLVLMDVGAEYNYYTADITRTFPVSGKFTKRQKQIYNIVLKTQLEVIKAAKPGITMNDLEDLCRNILSEECKKIGLIKDKNELNNYFYHAVSHTLGLNCHDTRKQDGDILEPGMVITVEPGLYIKEEKLGIRIEDDILITEDGCQVLSKDIPKTIKEIEKLMKNKDTDD